MHPIELRRDKLKEVFSIGTGESQGDHLDVIVEGDLCSGDRASRAGHRLDLQGSVVQDVRNQCGTSRQKKDEQDERNSLSHAWVLNSLRSGFSTVSQAMARENQNRGSARV